MSGRRPAWGRARSALRFGAVEGVVLAACVLEGYPGLTVGWNVPFVAFVLGIVGVAGRRLQPETALLVGSPALGWATSTLSVVVLLFTVGEHQPRARVVHALGGLTLAVNCWGLWDPDDVGYSLSACVTEIMIISGAVGLGALVRTRRSERAQHAELDRVRAEEARLTAAAARADERAHLAREMHDVVSHHVALISLQAATLQVTSSEAATRETGATIGGLATATNEELRHILGGPQAAESPIDLTPPRGLVDLPELWSLCGPEGEFRIDPRLLANDVHATSPGRIVVAPAIQRATYRFVQEGLTNAGKHAPGAPVAVSVDVQGRELAVVVHTDAHPPDGGSGRRPGASDDIGRRGYGLRGLRERVEALGGTFDAGYDPVGGHRLAARMPLRPAL